MHKVNNSFCPRFADGVRGSSARGWTMVLLQELIAGSTSFKNCRRGLPADVSGPLVQALRELEEAGVVGRVRFIFSIAQTFAYRLTRDAGRESSRWWQAIGHVGRGGVETEPFLDLISMVDC